jgi:hypothetical protein
MEGTTTNNGIPISVETVTEGDEQVDAPPPTASLISPSNGGSAASIPPTAESASVDPERPTQLDIDYLKNELKSSLDEEQGLISKQIDLLTERQAIKTAIEKIKTDGQLLQLLEQKEMLEQLTSIATSI